METGSAEMNAAQHFIVVKAPVDLVYECWSHLEDLPKFIPPLQDVHRIDDAHFSYKWQPNGTDEKGVFHIGTSNSRTPNRVAHDVEWFHVRRGLFRATFSR